MPKTIIKAPKELATLDAMDFIRDMLNQYDLNMLSEIKWTYYPNYDYRHPVPNAHGNAKPPYPFAKTRKAKNTYRISNMIRGKSEDLPWSRKDYPTMKKMPRKYGRIHTPGELYNNLEELMAFIMGHEAYHYLAWTKQIPDNVYDERKANAMGDEWVGLYREWRE